MPKVFPLPPLPPPTLQAAVENQKPPQSKTLHEAEGEGGEEAIVEKAEVAEAAEVAMAAVEGAAVDGAERAGEAMVEAGLTAEEGILAASAAVATVGEAAAGAPCAGPG